MFRQPAILLFVFVLGPIGCSGKGTNRTFDQELQLTLRAGRGQLTEAEKRQLLKENHAILGQVSDPDAFQLFQFFSRLPESERQKMLDDTYVKWRMSELDPDIQELSRRVIKFILASHRINVSPLDADSESEVQAIYEKTEVGFAVVELGASKQKVVSWFAFGPELAMPLWVTIVNANASVSEEYVQAHMQRLPLLRSMKPTAPPKLHLNPTHHMTLA